MSPIEYLLLTLSRDFMKTFQQCEKFLSEGKPSRHKLSNEGQNNFELKVDNIIHAPVDTPIKTLH